MPMKKLYLSLLILFFFKLLDAQVKKPEILAVELPGSGFYFVNSKTGQKTTSQIWEEVGTFVNGFARVYHNQRWGFVDHQGNLVVPVKFESLRNFSNQLAAARQNSKWGFIDNKGNTIVPFVYDIIYDFTENITAAYKNRRWSLIDRQGKKIRDLDVDVFYGFRNGSARFLQKGRYGRMNTKGEIVSFEKSGPDIYEYETNTRQASTQATPCPDNIGFERGNFTNWECFVGEVDAVGTTNVITVTPSAPTPNRHVIYPAADPSEIDPYGLFPINPPDGSGYALKLGNNVNGAEAERVRYTITVPANAEEASITYRYAVVFQDPGHLRHQQPRFSAKLLDVETNKYLNCASYEYVADDTIPGFFSSPIDDSVKCKNWASVFINLSAYAGKTLILEFTTADCTLGAHWGYTYVDVGDCNVSAEIEFECNPNIARLSGPPGFRSYRWWDENYTNIIARSRNFTLNPAPPGNTPLHLEVIPSNGAGCSDTLHVTAINISPIADAGPDKTICAGSRTFIGSNTVSGHTYTWTPSDFLTNPNIAMPVVTGTTTTTYVVAVTKTSNGCIAYDTVTVNVNPKPMAVFDPGENQCMEGNSFSFTNNSIGASQYKWYFGDGDTSLQRTPSHHYELPGEFAVKLVVTGNNGCQDSLTRDVTVYSNPNVNTIDNSSICRGNTIRLQSSGAQTYEWSPAAGLSCNDCPNPIASPLTTTTYFVKGESSTGCPGYDTVTIEVHQPFEIRVEAGGEICANGSFNLSASGAVTYKWVPAGSLSNDTIPNPVATPGLTTTYRVVGFDAHNCFTDTGYVTVTVNPNPTLKLGPDLTLSTGTIVPLNPVVTNGPIVSWSWDPPLYLSCDDCPEPVATVKTDISYTARIQNIHGCEAVDTIRINTFCEGSQVFIPNAFTPDGDGVNDILMVRAKGVQVVKSFRIFSRWGELLFEKTNFPPNTPAFGWDGKIRGKTGAPEVYVYTAEVTCDNLQTYTYKGNTAILK